MNFGAGKMQRTTISISSTFTIEPLVPILKKLLIPIGIESIIVAPYQQMAQQFLDISSVFYQKENAANLIFITLIDILPEHALAEMKITNSSVKIIREHVTELLEFASKYSENQSQAIPCVFVLTPPPKSFYNDPLYVELEHEIVNELRLHSENNNYIYFIEGKSILDKYKLKTYFDYMANQIAHISYTNSYFFALALECARKIFYQFKSNYKVIVCDCDNTLWKGICGEEPVKVSDSFYFFQSLIKEQIQNGMLFCLCSKNNELDVIQTFNKTENMLLRWEDVTIAKLNWQNKSSNIIDIANELNLGLDSLIFIDDNPFECGEMEQLLPDVFTINIPSDDKLVPFLKNLWVLDHESITREDQLRSNLYRQEQVRQKIKNQSSSLEEYLRKLRIKFKVTSFEKKYFSRINQLMIRTNQFNTNKVIRNENEINARLAQNYQSLIVGVSDKFGDYGIVGYLEYKIKKRKLYITQFLLSCRVLGRDVEQLILNHIRELTANNFIDTLVIVFKPSIKNKPAHLFLESIVGSQMRFYSGISFYHLKTSSAFTFNVTNTLEKYNNKNASDIDPEKTANYSKIKDTRDLILTVATHAANLEQLARNLNLSSKIKRINNQNINRENHLIDEIILIFADTLGSNNIKKSTNFFEAGGDSLLAALVMSKICEKFNVEPNIVILFNYPSAEILARYIQDQKNHKKLNIPILTPEMRRRTLLSYAQERLYYLYKLTPDSSAYNMFIAYELRGNLNVMALNSAFKKIVEENESLRTIFEEENGSIFQIPLSIDQVFSNIIVEKYENHQNYSLYNLAKHEASTPFKLDTPPLFRIRLLELNNSHHILFLNLHHIISDGWSFNHMIGLMNKYYNLFQDGNGLSGENYHVLPQYIDFSTWHKNWLSEDIIEKQANYWKRQLQDWQSLEMPTISTSPLAKYNGKRLNFKIPKNVTLGLNELILRESVTLFNILYSALSLLFYRYTGQHDIIIGSPISNRHYPQVEKILGFFVNILLFRTTVHPQQTFTQFLRLNKGIVEEAYDNQDMPFQEIVKLLSPERDIRNPIVRAMFVFQNFKITALKLDKLETKRVFSDNENLLLADYESAKLDITLYMQKNENGGLDGLWEYNSNLFDESFISSLSSHFSSILLQISQQHDIKLNQVDILSKSEKSKIIYDWARGQSIVTKNADITLYEAFRKSCSINSNSIALYEEGAAVTFANLINEIELFATKLSRCGLGIKNRVVVFLDRSIAAVITTLSLLKLGAIYIPLDADCPRERLRYILSDCEPEYIITDSIKSNQFYQILHEQPHSVTLDYAYIYNQVIADFNLNPISITANDTAYIIYTSGSTGRPKGVVISHNSVIHLIAAQQFFMNYRNCNRVIQCSSLSCDASIWEIFGSLLSGATLYLVSKQNLLDPQDFENYIRSHEITTLTLTPTLLNTLSPHRLPSLKKLIMAGESSNPQLVERWLSPSRDLYNAYGPTEATVCATIACISSGYDTNLIGRPLSSEVEVYVLDDEGQLALPGAHGELHIGGIGLAKEYYHRESLTKERFIYNDLLKKRLYRTGDFVKWRQDGQLQFIGRRDEQIKIRGFRVELSEIVNCLTEIQGVKDAKVIKIGSPSVENLAAFVEINYVKFFEKFPDLIHTICNQWQKLYSQIYQNLTCGPDKFEITGWKNSYTDEDFSENIMQRWVKATADRILQLHPKKILEIGCGSGLIMRPLLSKISHYTGTDIVDDLIYKHQMHYLKNANIQFLKCFAHEIFLKSLPGFDTIILNSVIQYFPNVIYLINILNEITDINKNLKNIFLGDIRNYDHLIQFYAYRNYYRQENNVLDWKRLTLKHVNEEPELCLSPAFFKWYASQNPYIRGVEIQLKKDSDLNEMNMFRYDVILYPRTPTHFRHDLLWKDLYNQKFTLTSVRLEVLNNQCLAFKNIRNKRLEKSFILENLLSNELIDDSITISKEDFETGYISFDPEQFFKLGEELRKKTVVTWSLEHKECFDVAFLPQDSIFSENICELDNEVGVETISEIFCNQPYSPLNNKKITEKISTYIKDRLPSHMLPTQIQTLNRMPQTQSGKMDQQKLYKIIAENFEINNVVLNQNQDAFCRLKSIFAKTLSLNIELLYENSNFFSLGGHSLLVIKLIETIKNELGVSLTIKDVLDFPVIKDLFELIERKQNQPAIASPIRSRNTSLVKLRFNSQRNKLFLVHPVGGTLFPYLYLIEKIEKKYDIYGLQDPMLEYPPQLIDNMKKLVEYYVSLILSVQDEGPYYLLGYSLGGTIAVEIGRVLREKHNKTLGFVGLIDSWAITTNITSFDELKNQISKNKNLQKKLGSQPIEDQHLWMSICYKNISLIKSHQMKPFDFNIILFKAFEVDKKLRHYDDEYNFWQDYSRKKVTVFKVSGNHDTVLTLPLITSLSNNINKYLIQGKGILENRMKHTWKEQS